MESRLGRPIDIRQSQQANFISQNRVRNKSTVSFRPDRGLYRREELVDGFITDIDGYRDTLPTFRGADFVRLVDEAVGLGKKPTILDLGYGSGKFLLDCADRWDDSVILQGYGSRAFTEVDYKLGEKTVNRTAPALKEKGIKLIDGDIIDLSTVYGQNGADFIVSSAALQYIYHYPQWEVTKKIYRALKPEGVAQLRWNKPTARHLRNEVGRYLRTLGYQFDFQDGAFAFRKTKPDISVPIRSVRSGLWPSFKISSDLSAKIEALRLP